MDESWLERVCVLDLVFLALGVVKALGTFPVSRDCFGSGDPLALHRFMGWVIFWERTASVFTVLGSAVSRKRG